MAAWLFGVLLVPLQVLAAMPHEARVPGGIAIVDVPSSTTRVEVDGKRVTVLNGRAFVGISLLQAPGDVEVRITTASGESMQRLHIKPKHYRTQKLTIADKRLVEPNEEDKARIAREQVVLDATRARFTDSDLQDLLFRRPVTGRLSDSFGSRRILNGQARNPHQGLDIAAPVGAEIRVPKAGVVAAIGDFFFTGNTVLIDHGQGVLSMYCHLSELAIHEGDRVEQGALLGKVGQTGRATGPHLHWAIYLNQTAVDPQLLLGE